MIHFATGEWHYINKRKREKGALWATGCGKWLRADRTHLRDWARVDCVACKRNMSALQQEEYCVSKRREQWT